MNIVFFLISIFSNFIFTKPIWVISNLAITLLFISSPFLIKGYTYSENVKYYLLAQVSCLLTYHFSNSVYQGIPLGFLKMLAFIIAFSFLIKLAFNK